MKYRGRAVATAVLAASLAACGGGGGDDTSTGPLNPAPPTGVVASVVSAPVPGADTFQASGDYVATNRGLYVHTYSDTSTRILKLHGSPTFNDWTTTEIPGFVANFAPGKRDNEADREINFYWHTSGIGAKWGHYTANSGGISIEMPDDIKIGNVAAGGREGVITPRPWVIASPGDPFLAHVMQDDGAYTASNNASDRFSVAAPGSVDPESLLLSHPSDPRLFVGSGDTLHVYAPTAVESSVKMPAAAGFASFNDFIWHDGELWLSYGTKVYRRSSAGVITEFAEQQNVGSNGALPGRFCIQGGEILMSDGTAKRISDGRVRNWLSSGELSTDQQMEASLLAATLVQVYCSSASSGVYSPSADGKTIRMIFPVQAGGASSGGSTGGSTGGTGSTDGSGDTDAAPADKYAGTWGACWSEDDGSSTRESIEITKTGPSTVAFNYSGTAYAGGNCTGAVIGTASGAGTATIVGTKTIGAQTVDKVNIVEGGASEKQVFALVNGRFFSGIPTDEPGSNPDAEGYPGALDPQPYSRQ